MKKFAFAAVASLLAVSAQAADYPKECRELIDLTYEAAEVMPEMKESLGMDKETMIKTSLDAWAEMSAAEQEQSLQACKASTEQMKMIIEAAKAQK